MIQHPGGLTPADASRANQEAMSDAKKGGGPVKLNAAEIIGTETDAFNDILNREVEVLTGLMFGAGNKRNTQDGDWTPVTLPLRDLIHGFNGGGSAQEFGFSRHPEAKKKEGPCIVLGSSLGGARKAKAMKTMYFLGLDIDSGASLDDVLDTLEDQGRACFVHTSFNHGKQGLELKRDEVLRKLGIKTDPKLDQIKNFMREHSKCCYEDSFIEAVTIADAKKQTKDGVGIELDTPPLDKFRLIFPLAKPVEIIELAETHQEALDIWEEAVTGLARNVLGIHFDTSCTDPSRLFYTARHPKGNNDWYCCIVRGDPLDFHTIPRMKKSTYNASRTGNAFTQASDGEARSAVVTESGLNLSDWHSKVGKARFMLADLLEIYCPDKIRVAGGEAQGQVHTECPFEHEHSSEGGTATMAINALDADTGYWTWFCRHDACQGRDKKEFLAEALRAGWFDESRLTDEEFVMPPADDEYEVLDGGDSWPTTEELIEGMFADKDGNPVESKEQAVRDVMKRLHERGADAIERKEINDLIKAETGLDLRTIKSFWADIDRADREAEAGDAGSDPIVTEADFDVMVQYAVDRINEANAETPRLFHYMERRAEVWPHPLSGTKIQLLGLDGFAALLNSVSKFRGKVGDKRFRHVAAPQDVVRHLFASAPKGLPVLRGLVTSPTYSKTGEVLTEKGYHEASQLYYAPSDNLTIPPLPDAPSDAELAEAKRLLIEECFADFPLGGLTRTEIVEQCLEGDGIPAVTHLLCFVLLPFCRDMIDGPTPGHLIKKPTPGTGASLLTEVASIISTGAVTPSMAMPTNKDEMGKTLTSVLANGQNIVFFDNINDKVDSAEFASALTAKVYAARILGKSQTVSVEVRCAWVLTGNNVPLSGELARRMVLVDLDARMARPEDREGFRHANLRGWVEANRGLLVWACLVIVQNWVAKGMPDSGEKVLASYESWSRVMAGILAEAGIGGFLGNSDELQKSANRDRQGADHLLMRLLAENFDDGALFRPAGKRKFGGVKTRSLIEVLNAHNSGDEEPILIPQGGYEFDKGAETNLYTNATKLRDALGRYVGRTYEFEVGGVAWLATLEIHEDTRGGGFVFKLAKRPKVEEGGGASAPVG